MSQPNWGIGYVNDASLNRWPDQSLSSAVLAHEPLVWLAFSQHCQDSGHRDIAALGRLLQHALVGTAPPRHAYPKLRRLAKRVVAVLRAFRGTEHGPDDVNNQLAETLSSCCRLSLE